MLWGYLGGSSGGKLSGWPPRGGPVPLEISDADVNEKHPTVEGTTLSKIRKLMNRHKVDIYLVMEQDEHGSEYVADRDRRIRFVSGFPGSAAFVSIGSDWAELATDSRYYLIAEKRLSSEWSLRKLGLPGVASWDEAVVKRAIDAKVDIGVDPRLINDVVARRLQVALVAGGRRLVPIDINLVDAVWGSDQPELPAVKVESLPPYLTGETADSKIAFVRHKLNESQTKTFVVYNLDEVAWLLNLRGGDVPYVPVFKSFLLITQHTVRLYTDSSKLPFDSGSHEGVELEIRPYGQFFSDLAKAPKPYWIPSGASWATAKVVDESFVKADISPINLRKAVKNCTEILGAREAQVKCSLSIVKYLAWLGQHIDEGLNEYQGGEKLLSIRETLPDFKGNSFETISAVGKNAAMPHYAPEPEGSATIKREEIYLLDSGSQFYQGSTDITRTVHYGAPSAEEVHAYTLVMKGQLAVSSCVFPEGTSGAKLDILARQFLWEEGLDYGHGTGHGIGSYLNIHELPLGIGMSSGPESILEAGHFVSDEPGYYKADHFGIRLENDILVVPAATKGHFNNKKFLTFDTLTVVPYDQALIDPALLTFKEKAILNAYHTRCRETLLSYLEEDYEREWLLKQTQLIE